MKNRYRSVALAGVSVAVLALPLAAQAQTADGAAGPAQLQPQVQGGGNLGVSYPADSQAQTEGKGQSRSDNGAPGSARTPALDEIIVTAQRRSTKLERTPVSVAVISADTLAKAAISTQADLQTAVPGLLVRQTTNSNDLNYAIRGQSLDAFSSTRPGVLPYFNEVQLGGGASGSFYDLDSVQVLKGPQGTLFGRSATGGAVLFTSAKPTNEFGGYVSAAAGSYNTYKGEGAINVPLVPDTLLARLSGFAQSNSGYQYDLYQRRTLGDSDRYGGRLSVEARIGSKLKNNLVVDYYHAKGRSITGVISSINPSAPLPVTSLYSNATFPAGSGPLTGTVISDFIVSQLLQAQGVPPAVANALTAGNYAAYIAARNSPYVPAGGLAAALAAQNARGPYQVAIDTPDNFKTRNLIVTNSTVYDLADDTQLKNIFGYTKLHQGISQDTDGTAFGIASSGLSPDSQIRTTTKQVSDELQIIGKAAGGDLQYVAGLYYQHESALTNQDSFFLDIALGGIVQKNLSRRDNTTYAAYAQGTYDLSGITDIKGLGATLGLRYTDEKVENTTLPGDIAYGLAAANPNVFSNHQSRKFKNVGWTLGLQDQLDPNTLIYVASRRSFKDGGYNGLVAPKIGFGDVGGNGYQTETVTDVELGAKFQGLVSGAPVRLNAAAYYNWIKNNQRTAFVSANGTPAAITVNVPQAEVYGFEADGQINPVSWLRFGGSINYTIGRFTKNSVNVLAVVEQFTTYPDTPHWSGDIFADISAPISDRFKANLHGDVFGISKTYFGPTEDLNPGTFNVGYKLVNLRLDLEDKRSGWRLSANVKNVLNKIYYVGGFPVGQIVGTNTRIPGAPRTFLVEVRHNF